MKRPSSKTFFLISITVLTLLVFVNLRRQIGFPDTRFPLEKGEKIKMDAGGAVQTFIASRDGLSGVNILFGGSSIKNGGTLSFALLDETCQKTLREEQRFVTTLNADNSTNFAFDRISDSAEKTFCLTLNFAPEKGTSKAALFVIPNTLPQEKLALSINGENRPTESLALRPVYRSGSIVADLTELNQRISQYKPWFLKSAFLTVITVFSIGLSLGFLLIATVFSEKKRHKK